MKRLFLALIAVWTVGLGIGVLMLNSESAELPKVEEKILNAKVPEPTGTFQVRSSTIAEKKTVAIQFFGDIMLDRNVKKVMATSGLDYIFENVAKSNLLNNAEIKIANLEGPFIAKKIKTSKTIAFGFDPAYLNELKKYGFSAFNLANNHSYDMGRSASAFTRKYLEENNVGWFGDELTESIDFTWFTTSSDGARLAFIGVHNTYHRPDRTKLSKILSEAKNLADLVIVNVHWGEEYHATSTKSQREFGQWFVDNGADAVIGHHPHVVQEMEVYKEKPIFYSLGNFIFDQYFSKETQEGLSVKISISEKKLSSIEILPFRSEKSKIVEMNPEELSAFMVNFEALSRLGDKKIINGMLAF